MKFHKIKLITPLSSNAKLKQGFAAMICMLFFGVVSGQTNNALKGTAEAQTLQTTFLFWRNF